MVCDSGEGDLKRFLTCICMTTILVSEAITFKQTLISQNYEGHVKFDWNQRNVKW